MLYRGMDRAQLDAAYNNIAAVANYETIKADWSARSERVRQSRGGHLDLRYGDAPRQRLDLFLAGIPRAPTLMFVHGGYWQRNNKEEYAFLAEGPLAHGLAPNARMDEIVGEIHRAIAWLIEHLTLVKSKCFDQKRSCSRTRAQDVTSQCSGHVVPQWARVAHVHKGSH
jgi:arylformamidase